jgi:hypothetical protein
MLKKMLPIGDQRLAPAQFKHDFSQAFYGHIADKLQGKKE